MTRIIVITLMCWVAGTIILRLNKYAFKHPTTHIVPSGLRHTWFAGLSMLVSFFIYCLPGYLFGYWPVTTFALVFLTVLFKKKSVDLLIDDLRLHKMEGRGLFQHSDDCYMANGGIATFVKKRMEMRAQRMQNSNPLE